MGEINNYSKILFTLSAISLLMLMMGAVNTGLRNYDTIIEHFMSVEMENTIGIITAFTLITTLISGIVISFIKD
tara:strand:- start:1432 stop:1653 length:222 start_codon:yes stop_codon:yes gene_type:complete